MILFILMWSLTSSIIMAISSTSMFSLWICMEINMMMFIPLMNSKNASSSNSMLLYFTIQATASSLFIFSFFFFWLNPLFTSTFNNLITSAILMKLGAAPFHFWFPQVSEGLSFFSFFTLTIFQKIIPLYILAFSNNMMLLLSIFFSSVIGPLGGWNQISIRKIIAFSSISHLAWIISIIKISSNWWILYFFIYSMILASLFLILQKKNTSHLTQINYFSSEINKFSLIIILLSLGGMPPLLGFTLKWLSIKIISLNFPVLLIFLIPSSLLNLYFYLRILYPFFLKKFQKNHLFYSNEKKSTIWMLIHWFSLFFFIPLI
nr:NADH dehydrogenase subunit 2 [Ogadenus brumpti ssp. 1 BJM-2017]